MSDVYKAAEQIIADSDRLGQIDEYRELSDLHRKLILWHARDPLLSKEELAKKAGTTRAEVFSLFYSKAFEAITEKLAQQEMSELLLLAAKKLRDLLMTGSDKVKMDTAITLLQSRDIIKSAPRSVRSEKKMVVFWGDNADKKLLGEVIKNGDKDTVLSAPEAGGSTQLEGPV